VAFSLNPLLLKLALQQKWSEIRTTSQRFGKLYRSAGGDSEYSHFSFQCLANTQFIWIISRLSGGAVSKSLKSGSANCAPVNGEIGFAACQFL
jgi:hypothetical protein